MDHLARLSRQRITRMCLTVGGLIGVVTMISSLHAREIWRVTPPSGASLVATPMSDGKSMVAVLAGKPFRGNLVANSASGKTSCEVVGFDSTTRLVSMRAHGDGFGDKLAWCETIPSASGTAAFGALSGTVLRGTTQGWVYQVRDKILPLGLILVSFEKGKPEQGSAVLDEQGRVLGLVFETAGPTSIYLLPAPAVLRVESDLAKHGKLVKGWLGLGLNSRDPAPRITGVQPNSPALKAGIRQGDILQSVADRSVRSYGQAVDAFFYLRPSTTVPIRIQRGTQSMSFTVSPILAP